MAYFIANAVLAGLSVAILVFMFSKKKKHIISLGNKHVFLTNACNGLGFYVAKMCLSEGAFVTLTDKSHNKLLSAQECLTKTANCSSDHILLKEVDLADLAAASSAMKEIFALRPIDIVICNSDMGCFGEFDNADMGKLETVIRNNFAGNVFCLHSVLRLMKARSFDSPSLVAIVGSLTSRVPMLHADMYTPTMAAMKAVADSLRIELMKYNIPVSFACPCFTATREIQEGDYYSDEFGSYEKTHAEMPEVIARKIINGIKNGDDVIITGFDGFLVNVLGRGYIPANSLLRSIIELISVVPARIASMIWYSQVNKLMQKRLHANRVKRENQKRVPYKLNLDDSAADDDENLDLWCH